MTRPRPGSLADRLYGLLLRLFPAEFRGDFAGDMALDFRDECRAAQAGGLGAVLRLWLRTLPSMIRTAARQHLDELSQDVRYALRAMARTPGFTVAAVVMLALGTGANAAMFSVIDAVMMRSPFTDPGRLAIVRVQPNGQGATSAVSPAQLERLAASPAFEAVAALGGGSAVMTSLGPPQRVVLECLSAAMPRVLGTTPLFGRWYSEDEDRPGGPNVVVLGYGFWQREFAGNPDAIGRSLTLNGQQATIVGIMPRGFLGPFSRNSSMMWAPVGQAREHESSIGCRAWDSVNVFGRVKSPLSLDGAERAINSTGVFADSTAPGDAPGGRVLLNSLEEQTLSDIRAPMFALVGAVVFVLLIACANVATLQLERTLGRRREMAVRLALGASRGRIVRQTLTENLVLAFAGAMGGLVVARLTLGALVSLLPGNIPHLDEIELNGRILTATVAVACLAGLLIGIVPGLQATVPVISGDLKDSSRTTTRSGQWTRRALVVFEIAASVVLVIGAALMIRTFLTLNPTRPGFDPANKVAAHVRLAGARFGNAANLTFADNALSRMKLLPGVQGVSLSTYLPVSGMVSVTKVRTEGRTADMWGAAITPNYLAEMAIPVVGGRGFTPADDARSMPVAIINEAAELRFWSGRSALGGTIEMMDAGRGESRTIVGVLRNTRSLGADLRSRPELYVPYAQDPEPSLYLLLRTDGPADGRLPAAIRTVVAEINPNQVVDAIESLQDVLDRSVATWRFGASLLGLFAVMAAGLAAAGLATTIAWWVAQRTREIGLRMALGASPGGIARLFVRQGLTVTAAGTLIGLLAAASATRLIASWLYGVTPFDARTYAGGAAVMLAIAALASYLPARRAARVDPLATLRAE